MAHASLRPDSLVPLPAAGWAGPSSRDRFRSLGCRRGHGAANRRVRRRLSGALTPPSGKVDCQHRRPPSEASSGRWGGTTTAGSSPAAPNWAWWPASSVSPDAVAWIRPTERTVSPSSTPAKGCSHNWCRTNGAVTELTYSWLRRLIRLRPDGTQRWTTDVRRARSVRATPPSGSA